MTTSHTPERREKQEPVPKDWQKHLNDLQLTALRQLESFGWEIKFIRRPLFHIPLVMLLHPNGKDMGVLEEDGSVNQAHSVVIRD